MTLHRFELKPDKLARFDDWMRFQHRMHRAALATLERKRMYVEAIFRDRSREPGVIYWIYWLTVEGEGGGHTDTSPFDFDRQHQAYIEEVLQLGSHSRLTTENVLIPDFVVEAVRTHQSAKSFTEGGVRDR